jgi:N-acetylglucosamine malate deacetylase 1
VPLHLFCAGEGEERRAWKLPSARRRPVPATWIKPSWREPLILAPHPDDEVVACGIAAMRAGAAGESVFVLYLTTGVPQRRGHGARVSRRRQEALAAAALLGLEPAGFRGAPARCLRHDFDAACRDIEDALQFSAAGELWVPAFEGGHQDHDAANALAAAFVDRLPVWESAAYNFAGARVRANSFADRRGGEHTIGATPREAALQRQALALYASERGNLGHVDPVHEARRALPAHDYGAPPHAGKLFRERFHWVPFRHRRIDWAASAEVYRDIGAWASARPAPRPAALGDQPSGKPRQADGKFADALDEAKREGSVGGQPGDPGEGDERGFLGPPAAGDQEGQAAHRQAEAFQQCRFGNARRLAHQP